MLEFVIKMVWIAVLSFCSIFVVGYTNHENVSFPLFTNRLTVFCSERASDYKCSSVVHSLAVWLGSVARKRGGWIRGVNCHFAHTLSLGRLWVSPTNKRFPLAPGATRGVAAEELLFHVSRDVMAVKLHLAWAEAVSSFLSEGSLACKGVC